MDVGGSRREDGNDEAGGAFYIAHKRRQELDGVGNRGVVQEITDRRREDNGYKEKGRKGRERLRGAL